MLPFHVVAIIHVKSPDFFTNLFHEFQASSEQTRSRIEYADVVRLMPVLSILLIFDNS